MKTCEDIEKKLPLYMDGLLERGDQEAILQHLQSCPHCANTLEYLRKTRMWVEDLPEAEPPPWLKQKIMADVYDEQEKKSLASKWFYPLRIKIPVQIFATLCIAVLAVYIYQSGEKMTHVIVPSAPPVEEYSEDRAVKPGLETSFPEKKSAKSSPDANPVLPEGAQGQMMADHSGEPGAAASAPRSFNQRVMEKQKRSDSDIAVAASEAVGIPRMQDAPAMFNMMIGVDDVDVAAREVENLFFKYEAKNRVKRIAPDQAILRADLPVKHLDAFGGELKKKGLLDKGGALPAASGEYIRLSVTIVQNK